MWTVLQNIATAWFERGRDGYALTVIILFLVFALAFAYLAVQAGDGLATLIRALFKV